MAVEQTRLPDSLTTSICRHGPMVYLRNDRYIGRSLHVYGEFSELECGLLTGLLSPGAVVIEAGANIGAHTLALAAAVGEHGRVLAFEPHPVNHRLLTANVALSGRTNVEVWGTALGAEPGTLCVPPVDFDNPGNFGGIALTASGDGTRVQVTHLDELELTRCDLIKADVEGMEQAVVRGATRTIERRRPLLYLENDRIEHSPALIALLLELGYSPFWHLPPLFNPDNFRGRKRNLFPGLVSVNLLCLPDQRPVPCAALRPVQSPGDYWR
ncbi:MAG: FkbM family methyltransferase [Gammaproteobacteria bacterium]|nr:FkbM family methyltransferase [Gammaproteobacteria bacterium]